MATNEILSKQEKLNIDLIAIKNEIQKIYSLQCALFLLSETLSDNYSIQKEALSYLTGLLEGHLNNIEQMINKATYCSYFD